MDESSSNQQLDTAVTVNMSNTPITDRLSETAAGSDGTSAGLSEASLESESLERLRAEWEQLKAERAASEVKYLKAEIARFKAQDQQLATLRSQSSIGGVARSVAATASFQTPDPSGISSSSLDSFQGPSPAAHKDRHDVFEVESLIQLGCD
jgi:hypothetical protein